MILLIALLAVLPARAEWKLVWQDKFLDPGAPNPNNWEALSGGGGWGNDEAQFYRPENAFVSDGNLLIEARYSGDEYSSARLISRESWTYGRVVVRAKLPVGRGTWPAIWMMPASPEWNNGAWPDNGEIDIMEHVGFDYGVVHGSLHMKTYNWMHGNQPTAVVGVPGVESLFHDYAIEWDPESITFLVDDKPYLNYRNPHQTRGEWPFDKPFYLILNVAIGGSWGGEKGIDDSAFPQGMRIESVKVFQDAKVQGTTRAKTPPARMIPSKDASPGYPRNRL